MANLYDKAGLVNIPVGYQDGFLYNIKPTDNTLAFRFNRDSAATRVNKEGLIEQVGYFGPELVTNGDFSDNTNDWETEGNSSISVGTYEGRSNVANINILNTSTSSRIRQPFNYVNGKKYKVSVDVFVVSGSFRVDSSDSFVSGDFVSTTTTGSWVTLSAEIEAIGTGSNYIWLRSISQVSQFYVSNVSVTEVLGDKPRIDYTDSLTSPSFLLEPQSTNLLPYSEDFSQSQWVKQSSGVASAPVVTSDYAVSPDGTLSADRVVFNINGGTTSSDFSQLAESVTSSVGDLTNSIFIKSNTASNYNMSFIDPIGGTPTSIVVTSEWQRFNITSTLTTTTSTLKLRLRGSEATSDFADVSVWGAQLEEQSFATSYIPTAGSTVTRAQETCNGAGSESTFNSTEGVFYAEIAALANENSTTGISINDGTTSNAVQLFITNTINQIRARVSNSTAQFFEEFTLSDITNFNKIAIKYKQNDFALWVNGNEVATDTSGNTPLGLNNLSFDRGDGSNDFNGKVKGIYVFNEALTEDELQQLTGPEYNSFAALAAAYNYTVI